MGATGGELVTLVVFAMKEKGLNPHDLQAWFQRRPGFVAMQVNERIDGLFVRFASPQHAELALKAGSNEGVAAEWARRNLDDDRGGASSQLAGAAMAQALPALHRGHGGFGAVAGGAAGRRIGATGGDLLTICVRLMQKEVPVSTMQDFFSTQPGFDRLQVNERIGCLFVKFFSVTDAERAIAEAETQGFKAEWARRNLDDDQQTRAQSMPPAALAAAPVALPFQRGAVAGGGLGGAFGGVGAGLGGGPAKRQRVSTGEIDTVTVLHVRERNSDVDEMQRWWALRPGYVALQINERIDAMFIKFTSRFEAEQAMLEAKTLGVGAEWARRNLDL